MLRSRLFVVISSMGFLLGCGEPATGKKTEVSNQTGWHSPTRPEIHFVEKQEPRESEK